MENINNLKKESFHFSTEYCPAGIFEQTKNIYDWLSRYNANSADVLHLLGGLAYSAGQFFDAIELFKKAIENDSTKSEFYHDLGAAYYETGDLYKAISYETHMVEELEYKVPKLLRKALQSIIKKGHFFIMRWI